MLRYRFGCNLHSFAATLLLVVLLFSPPLCAQQTDASASTDAAVTIAIPVYTPDDAPLRRGMHGAPIAPANRTGAISGSSARAPHAIAAFSVTNLNDAGAGSLRQAILDANAAAGSDVISFTVTGIITLTSGQLVIGGDLTISGPGAGQLTVSGSNSSRVFVVNGGTTVVFSGLTIANGFVNGFGAGIHNSGNLTLDKCVVTGNVATGSVSGGGIFSSGPLLVTNSLIINNTCDFGAGIAQYAPGTATVINTTVTGNHSPAATGGAGAGLLSGFTGAQVNTVNCTVTNNTIANNTGGGICVGGNGSSSGNASYRNSIIAGNSSPNILNLSIGLLTSLGHNIVSDGTGNLIAAGDMPNTNPQLAALGNYGGPTQTHPLKFNSPGIDAGDNLGVAAFDQRGLPRVADGNCDATATVDIGAVEAQMYMVTNTADAGAGSLRAALAANSGAGYGVICFGIGTSGSAHTITPASLLPYLTRPVFLDGWSQGGSSYTGPPLIEIDGSSIVNGFGFCIINTPNNVIRGFTINRVSGTNNGAGIILFGPGAHGNWMYGNRIGCDPSGSSALGTAMVGVYLFNGTNNNLIGTNADGVHDAAEGNLISGNSRQGIIVWGLTEGAVENRIYGNTIGLNASGASPLPNGEGILIFDNAVGNVVGGTHPAMPNKVAGNSIRGIRVASANSTGNMIIGNHVANNNGAGVSVVDATTSRITGNSIHDNAGLGIDLDLNGVTPNDAGDGDGGGNLRQNFPVLTSAFDIAGTTTVSGTFNGAPSSPFTVEVFTQSACDPSGYGEGKTLVKTLAVNTDAGGNAAFSFALASGFATGTTFTATAADAAGNTSEFSACRRVDHPPVADAGPDQTVECVSHMGTLVTLDGSGSTDPDGDVLTYTWRENGNVIAGPSASATAQVQFMLGTHTVELTVADPDGLSSTDIVIITVEDTQPPVISSITLSPSMLWPPNHNMKNISATVVASDVCDPNPVITLVGITSNEPDNGLGDGDMPNDIAINGTFDFDLRAERSGTGSGRVYTATYTVTDASGNSTSGTAVVTVPLFVSPKQSTGALAAAGTLLLEQNYPNPFNPSTTIAYQLPIDGQVTLEVFNSSGQQVATLVNTAQSAGRHSVLFDATDLPGGTYIARLTAGGVSLVTKLQLVK